MATTVNLIYFQLKYFLKPCRFNNFQVNETISLTKEHNISLLQTHITSYFLESYDLSFFILSCHQIE